MFQTGERESSYSYNQQPPKGSYTCTYTHTHIHMYKHIHIFYIQFVVISVFFMLLNILYHKSMYTYL